MPPLALLSTQVLFAIVAFVLLGARLAPWVRRLPQALALELLLWLHVPRSLPLALLAPGQVAGVDPSVAWVIAGGDFASAVAALVAIVALRARPDRALPWVWLFTVVSCVDIVSARSVGLGTRVYEQPLGVAWFILTAYVPLVCVAQAATVGLLVRPGTPWRFNHGNSPWITIA